MTVGELVTELINNSTWNDKVLVWHPANDDITEHVKLEFDNNTVLITNDTSKN